MASGRVLAVSTGVIREMVIGGRPGVSAIGKQPLRGPVLLGKLGLAGDEHADAVGHGGYDQALYAYAREDLDWWTEQLGRELRNAEFGENVTTSGIDVNAALIGEVWQLGEAVVQITAPRIPCVTFQSWTGEDHWVKRFAAAGRPGPYFRVLTEGHIKAGDPIEVLSKPDQQVSVTESMHAFYGDCELMELLLTVPGRGGIWDKIGAEILGRTQRTGA